MMTNVNEKMVRERAYYIWEREGRPAGKELDHWQTALIELGFANKSTNGAVAKPIATAEAPAAKPSRKSRIKSIVAEAKDALSGASTEVKKPRKRAAKADIDSGSHSPQPS
jgi:Tfp pilus assembly protein FimV